MNGKVVEESSRPRPQSAGIWTLFSWLRRSDRSSSESISSVGSDRTALSFDFLAPVQYGINNPPRILRSSPPTDTYKKRLHERNIRRLRDQDISIHRKYGLFGVELGYDTLNSNSTYTDKTSFCSDQKALRERRATSECIHRRAAYVPGKRRAPQPPLPATAVTLPRIHKRKRPAPKPPTSNSENKENHEINQSFRMSNISGDELNGQSCVKLRVPKSDVNSEHCSSKDKSFLKQIFVNRKRNSAIDTSHIKLLPISELDKQAQEIIERNKVLRANDTNCDTQETGTNLWICKKCLRRYNATILSCVYCVAEEKPSATASLSKRITIDGSNMYTQTENMANVKSEKGKDEKEKLKEMLKEMKDSLPKRSKHEIRKSNNSQIIPITETSTLRIGQAIPESSTIVNSDPQNNFKSNQTVNGNIIDSGIESKNTEILNAKEKFLNLQPSSFTPKLHNDNNQNFSQSKIAAVTGSSINNPYLALSKQTERRLDNVSIKPQINVAIKNNEFVKQTKENGKDANVTRNHNLLLARKDISAVNEMNVNVSDTYKPVSSQVCTDTHISNSDNKSATSEHFCQVDKLCNASGVDREINITNIPNLHCDDKSNCSGADKKNIMLQSPMKISTLLNPLYTPKCNKKIENNYLQKCDSENKSISVSIPCNKIQSVSFSSPPIDREKIDTSLATAMKDRIDGPTYNFASDLSTSSKMAPIEKNVENLNPYINRRTLISQLEQSIANGDEKTAAEVAAKLAKLRLSCSVLSFSSQIVKDGLNLMNQTKNLNNCVIDIKDEIKKTDGKQSDQIKADTSASNLTNTNRIVKVENKNTHLIASTSKINRESIKLDEPTTSQVKETEDAVTIEVWVEDKEAARGPICLRILRNATLKDLKQQAETSLAIAVKLQRWIIGKTLCTNEDTPIAALAGTDFVAPFYLCLVESADSLKDITSTNENSKTAHDQKNSEVYNELINLEKEALVPNSENFECEVCMEERAPGEGVVLRECIHIFCRECLRDAVRHCEEPTAACLAVGCSGTLQEREIRALLPPDDYEKWLARGLAAAECGTRNTFHCRTPDCKGWAFCESGVRKFPCPVCKKSNCIPCQAVHEGESCTQHQEKLQKAVSAAEKNDTDEGTQALLNSLISRGEALECPQCKAIITKKWGCDWVKCSACKTEICWVTRGPRWGPGGRGDTSAGCRCGLGGRRCHPTCGYCH